MSITKQLALMLGLLLAFPVAGDEVVPVAEVTDPISTVQAKSLWEVGIAGGAASYADYPASDQYRSRVLALPFFIYRGGIFRSDASGPRLRTEVGSVEWELSGGGALSSSSNSGARAGMPALDNILEVGPNAKMAIGNPTASSLVTVDLAVRAAVSTNISTRFNWRGVVFAPDVSFEDKSIAGSPWSGRVVLGTQFTTAQLQQYWYQVAPQYAQASRPAYAAKAGYLGSRLVLSASRPLTHNFSILGGGEFDSYSGAANQDSPLFKKSVGYTLFVGFSWSIWQSAERESSNGSLERFMKNDPQRQ